MATLRPSHCLRTLRRPRIQQQPSTIPSPFLLRLFSSTQHHHHPQWRRAVQAPSEYISFKEYREMMAKPPTEALRLAISSPLPSPPQDQQQPSSEQSTNSNPPNITEARLIPSSPSYFSTNPSMVDDIVHLASLLRRHGKLPKLPRMYTPQVTWKTAGEYSLWLGERVSRTRYVRILSMLTRLNSILPELRAQEVTDAINAHRKDADVQDDSTLVPALDEWGRGYGEGRRKTAKATAYVVEGSGEVLVNERRITDVFGRVKDRESALWPLTATGRMARYNVFAVVKGGGTTGWAEALAIAVAKAVLVHEPGLKRAMRKAGCIRRDPRMVERKKPGHVKARKMPAWVRR